MHCSPNYFHQRIKKEHNCLGQNNTADPGPPETLVQKVSHVGMAVEKVEGAGSLQSMCLFFFKKIYYLFIITIILAVLCLSCTVQGSSLRLMASAAVLHT